MKPRIGAIILVLSGILANPFAWGQPRPRQESIFARDNLVAWCIVPFDAKKRSPEDRAAMMARLGIKKYAYDWRAEHLPTLDREIAALKKHNIQLTAFWFPGSLSKDALFILETLKKHEIKTQLWVSTGVKADPDTEKMVEAAANSIKPIATEAGKIGCTVALYNHGGWFGEPDNQIAIIKLLKTQGITNVGIVYNQHHGHAHIAQFKEMLDRMKPYLLAINLNGMSKEGDKLGKKIMPIGQGELDIELVRIVRDSAWRGPVGILNHTDEDAEARLQDNMEGLAWVVGQLDAKEPASKPHPRSWRDPSTRPAQAPTPAPAAGPAPRPSIDKAFGQAVSGGILYDGKEAYRRSPITVELRTKLDAKNRYNILAACETKRSPLHWELFTMPASGFVTVYLPGHKPDHVRSKVDIANGQWHAIAMVYEASRLRIIVDGKVAADEKIELKNPAATIVAPGGIAFGRLVEGGIGCDGLIDDVRISKGARAIETVLPTPCKRDDSTIDLWNFDDLPPPSAIAPPTSTGINYWAVEDAAARAKLPLYQTIPAALPHELTDHNGWPGVADYRQWYRSHGNDANTRFSPLAQINKSNVKDLQVAWTYKSGDGKGNIQCNPIIVDGIMYTPTVGNHIAAVDAKTGKELWRFKPETRPSFRGITYYPGGDKLSPRILFPTEKALWALDPRTGKPIESFGDNGRVKIGECRVAPAIYKNVIVFPGYEKDVFGHDLATGKLLWTFHTIPQPGEEFYETWDKPDQGANCWGGSALDRSRGIFFITTGSPKPNFHGVRHRGDNLYSDCVVAINALTGKRLWHFQEIRHDIWDLDIPAPPVLVTVSHLGRKIDAVAACSKMGNTILLDRVTGKPLFPFRLRRAPASRLPGEVTAPYQPDLELPEPFARQTFTEDDVTTLSDEAERFIFDKTDEAKFGWFEPFDEGRKLIFYGVHGGAEWTGASFDPTTGMLYVSSNELPWNLAVHRFERPAIDETKLKPTPGRLVYQEMCMTCHGPSREGVGVNPSLLGISTRLKEEEVVALWRTGRASMPVAPPMTTQQQKDLLDYIFDRDRVYAKPTQRPERPNYRDIGFHKLLDNDQYPGCRPPWGTLVAINLNTGKLVWKVPLGEYPELTAKGIKKTGTENFGGASVTAGGLVFCAGTRDGLIRAFDKDTGEELWSHKLPHTGCAPPSVYEVDGKQYIVIPATGGGKLATPMGDTFVAFTLP